jgi:hypothetical protein
MVADPAVVELADAGNQAETTTGLPAALEQQNTLALEARGFIGTTALPIAAVEQVVLKPLQLWVRRKVGTVVAETATKVVLLLRKAPLLTLAAVVVVWGLVVEALVMADRVLSLFVTLALLAALAEQSLRLAGIPTTRLPQPTTTQRKEKKCHIS